MSEIGKCGHVTYGPQNIRGRCNNKAIGVADGLPHCGVHDPNRPDKVQRRAKAEARFNRRRAPDPRDAELARLRKAIEDAPHGPTCRTHFAEVGMPPPPSCDCWKARALGKEGA